MQITIEHVTNILVTALKNNAPVRSKPLGAVGKKGTPFYSPYPGNLKNNGITEHIGNNESHVQIGGKAAGYGPYTEKHSHKPGWIQQSKDEVIAKLKQMGGTVK